MQISYHFIVKGTIIITSLGDHAQRLTPKHCTLIDHHCHAHALFKIKLLFAIKVRLIGDVQKNVILISHMVVKRK